VVARLLGLLIQSLARSTYQPSGADTRALGASISLSLPSSCCLSRCALHFPQPLGLLSYSPSIYATCRRRYSSLPKIGDICVISLPTTRKIPIILTTLQGCTCTRI
jgi:hypothetical protein